MDKETKKRLEDLEGRQRESDQIINNMADSVDQLETSSKKSGEELQQQIQDLTQKTAALTDSLNDRKQPENTSLLTDGVETSKDGKDPGSVETSGDGKSPDDIDIDDSGELADQYKASQDRIAYLESDNYLQSKFTEFLRTMDIDNYMQLGRKLGYLDAGELQDPEAGQVIPGTDNRVLLSDVKPEDPTGWEEVESLGIWVKVTDISGENQE